MNDYYKIYMAIILRVQKNGLFFKDYEMQEKRGKLISSEPDFTRIIALLLTSLQFTPLCPSWV